MNNLQSTNSSMNQQSSDNLPILNYLKDTFTINTQISSGENDTITFELHRMEYSKFIENEEKKYACKFYNRTSGSKDRKQRNEEYLLHGYQPQVDEEVISESTDERPTKKAKKGGRTSTIFSEVLFTHPYFVDIFFSLKNKYGSSII